MFYPGVGDDMLQSAPAAAVPLASSLWTVTFSFFPGPVSKPTHRTAKDKAGGRLGPPGAAQIEFWPAETRFGNYLILVVIYPVERADKASAGVPLLWPGTDVLLDPGDQHGAIVPTRDRR